MADFGFFETALATMPIQEDVPYEGLMLEVSISIHS
jgi:hypothetical protein